MYNKYWTDEQNVLYRAIEYCSNIKRSEILNTCSNMKEPWEHYGKWKKPNTESHILYDFMYMKCPKYTNT